jgi:hypothetical protein
MSILNEDAKSKSVFKYWGFRRKTSQILTSRGRKSGVMQRIMSIFLTKSRRNWAVLRQTNNFKHTLAIELSIAVNRIEHKYKDCPSKKQHLCRRKCERHNCADSSGITVPQQYANVPL